jgi:DNA-binding transcriptional regulator WhiA
MVRQQFQVLQAALQDEKLKTKDLSTKIDTEVYVRSYERVCVFVCARVCMHACMCVYRLLCISYYYRRF